MCASLGRWFRVDEHVSESVHAVEFGFRVGCQHSRVRLSHRLTEHVVPRGSHAPIARFPVRLHRATTTQKAADTLHACAMGTDCSTCRASKIR